MTNETTVICEGLVWPESPRWHAGELWITEAFAEKSGVRSVSRDGTQTLHIPVSGGPAGMDFLSDGTAVLAAAFDRKILKRGPEDEVFSTFLDLDGIAAYPNELIVGPGDRIFIADSGFQVGVDPYQSGRLIVVETDGTASVLCDELPFPNGLAITPDGRTLTMAESFAGRLSQFKFGSDNSLLEHYVHVAFDNLGVIEDFEATFTRKSAPDGICLDEAGNIWVANPLEAKVRCISPTGQQVDEVVISQGGIACMLGGQNGTTLFVCTGDPLAMAQQNGRIEIAEVDVRGAGCPRSVIPQ
ncbi:SMP-30/gluconolactonase/LRE family protein [Shimia sp.]|uniref:SMP-30/gluconolactonase/LRE family protein n=1 Tax=Shimia sp. TaxID=1954381 RepID=UPI003B8C882B